NFTVRPGAGPTVVTLVAYNAPGPSFNAGAASQQTIFEEVTQTLQPGMHSLSITLPSNFYQVDFVIGDAITQFGPAGSNIFYPPQGRLVSADNGGTNPVVTAVPASLSGFVYADNNGTGLMAGNPGINHVVVTLTGTTTSNQPVTLTATTDSTG